MKMYTGLLPEMSAVLPTNVGTIADTIRYEVTVRLMFLMDVSRSFDIAVIAGKYMKLLKVENQPANATRNTIHRFCAFVKVEYGTSVISVSVVIVAAILLLSGMASQAFTIAGDIKEPCSNLE